MKTKPEATSHLLLGGRGLPTPVTFAVLWGVLALSTVSTVGAQDWPALDEIARGVELSEVQPDEWPFSHLDPELQEAVRRAVVDDDVRRGVSSLATTAGLDERSARALLYAVLHVLREPFPDTCEEVELPGEVEAELLAALVGEDPPPVVISIAGLALADAWRCPLGNRTLAALSAHRSAEAAFALASSADRWVREDLLQVIDDVDGPSIRVLLLRASDLEGVDRAAALEAANELAEAGQEPPDDLPGRRLAAYFDAGLWARALALLGERGEKALTAATEADGARGSDGGLPRHLDVAAAALLAGRRDLALKRLASREANDLEPPGEASTGTEPSWEERQEREAQALRVRLWQTIESAALGTGLADSFDRLAELALAVDSFDNDLSSRGTLLLFLSDLSRRLGFDSLAGYFRQPLSRQLNADDAVPGAASWRRLLARELATSMGRELADVEFPNGGEANGDLADRVPAGFRVRPLSSNGLGDAPPEPSLAEVPEGFGVVRSERGHGLDVVLAVSQALDPVGEVSTGAYWVLRSANGGVSWEAFHTGLRVGAPYEAFAPSRLPMLTPDGLAVEVRWAALDESSITFPPIGVAVDRREDPLVVNIPWAVLTSDRDGDGLTDLFEERVFTDPDECDTDGDGVPDFDDPLPGVAYAGGGSATSAAMAALMAEIGYETERAILPRCPNDRPGLCFGSSSPGLERVLFIVGDPADWTGVDPSRRTVVLTPEQHRRAERRFGPVYATTLEVFEVDGKGKRAVAIWNSRWQGGAAMLEKSELGWLVLLRSSWIT